MAPRISTAFERIRAEKRTGLVTFVTAGDPDMARSADILCALDRAGADCSGGLRFSEPPPTDPDSAATEGHGGRRHGLRAARLLSRASGRREGADCAVHLRHPVLRMGVASSAISLQQPVSGVLVLDRRSRGGHLSRRWDARTSHDLLIRPPTPIALKEARKLGRGFLYVSRGSRDLRGETSRMAEVLAGRCARRRAAVGRASHLVAEHVWQIAIRRRPLSSEACVGVSEGQEKGRDLIERVEA